MIDEAKINELRGLLLLFDGVTKVELQDHPTVDDGKYGPHLLIDAEFGLWESPESGFVTETYEPVKDNTGGDPIEELTFTDFRSACLNIVQRMALAQANRYYESRDDEAYVQQLADEEAMRKEWEDSRLEREP